MRRTIAFLLFLPACGPVAVALAPHKKPRPATSASKDANDRFWTALHGGAYDTLPDVIEGLEAVYLANPNDAVTTAHLGFAHTWQLAERARRASIPATITDEAVLASRYFEEAVALAPSDSRLLGFYGSTTLTVGKIHGDEKMQRRGYFALKDAAAAWPEFNLFTMGYTLSVLPYDDARFHDALEQQWQTLDLCIDGKIDRASPDYARYMSREVTTGTKRACWNSWIAPHNFEGFFLNMGDMLVKSGDVETAKKIYANARLSRTYAAWPFRDELEARVTSAATNVAAFRDQARDAKNPIMISTRFACTGCHEDAPRAP